MEWIYTVLQGAAKPFKWWTVIARWEQGVRVRLGKKTNLLLPGIHFRIPFLDRVYVHSTRTRISSASGQSVSLRGGKRIITFGISISYRIKNIVRLMETISQVEGFLLFEALSKATDYLATHDDVAIDGFVEAINKQLPGSEVGLEDVQVLVSTFCEAKCYRLISGDAWVCVGKNIDNNENSGER